MAALITLDHDADHDAGELQCPTCGARQVWSDTCRRCKCDLLLVHQLQQSLRRLRRRCLLELQQQQLEDALDTARHCYELSADTTHARLLALCQLLHGEWAEALQLYQTAAQ